MNMPSCLFSLGLALEACVKCSLAWLMWRVVMHKRFPKQLKSVFRLGFQTTGLVGQEGYDICSGRGFQLGGVWCPCRTSC